MAGERLLVDPEVRLQHARDMAWAALNRREHTEAQLREILARKRVEPDTAGTVLAELREGGWIDDAGYAKRFAEDRRNLDAWGADRIERRLRAAGVAPEHIAAALGERTRGAELDSAVEVLRRRFSDPPSTPRDAQRALGLLLRKGYDLELAHDALRRHGGRGEFDGC